jgi:hypothetical protein
VGGGRRIKKKTPSPSFLLLSKDLLPQRFFFVAKLRGNPCMAMAFLQDKNKIKESLAETEDFSMLKLIYLFVI